MDRAPDRRRSVHWEAAMETKLLAVSFLASTLAAGTASAQSFPFNAAGVTNGHWHLTSKDVAANEKIFVAMGGQAFQAGGRHRVRFPGVMIILDGAPGTPPASGPTVGSVVSHVGFIVNNLPEQVAKWKAAGVPVLPGNDGRLDQAFINTPDGLRIEILENKSQSVPIQSEHVHFSLPEGAIAESQAWYGRIFGAKPGVRNNAPIADIPGVQLRFARADTAQAPTKGRILDHIGFDVKDLKAFVKTLEANNIKLDRPYLVNDSGVGIVFITDPWGTYVEINERPGQ
jgi:catechol 2,3-dioxygenase-like lactoylglutathione lyase family enzyme/extradiol dioxygenase family protein